MATKVSIYKVSVETIDSIEANATIEIVNGKITKYESLNDSCSVIRQGNCCIPAANALKAKAIALWCNEQGEYPDDYGVRFCVSTHLWGFEEEMTYIPSRDGWALNALVVWFGDEPYLTSDCERQWFRDDDGERREPAPSWIWENMCFCTCCNNYVARDDYDSYEDHCVWCEVQEEESVIESYCKSHEHNLNPIFFGSFEGEFKGMGFELEVEPTEDTSNEEIARSLIEVSELEPNELRYALDSTVEEGFEIISEPHTFDCFWGKRENWERMLSFLQENGYRSHDGGKCGLHIHVSRAFFGETTERQDNTIGKIYAFFDSSWDDLVKASRRKYFGYCERVEMWDENCIKFLQKSKAKAWTVFAKKKNGGHGVALNNLNSNTFEFRLGRGTLVKESFFAWINLIQAICVNANRISFKSVDTNDSVSWLAGISLDTAKYLMKRGAFTDAVNALFPNQTWE